ncbi:Target of rapamycin complex 2 subunit AVO2 [Cladobotryum mycophilum]|uniref:Target of rapamycin complex 2 subunit AVO2 n=1 Tax=Cladobotryum mycophilum TaxID=491253 RepID=A0ABR0SU48_9HYPO
MKDKQEVITEFNELVNMTAKELEDWLKSDDSRSAGWPKENDDGESIGHESGRQIVDILESNPDKDSEKYTDEQIQHMRKVVSYCKRHLAQEEKANDEKSVEEVEKTKSYASLKNWGHDCIKKREEKADVEEDKDSVDIEEPKTGEKREADDDQSGESKKRKTDDVEPEANGKEVSNGGAEEEEEDETKVQEDEDEQEQNADEETEEKATKGPEKGDTVSWNWGQGQPEGKVVDVRPEKTTIETKNGNEVSRNGKPEDPAVVLDTGKSEAIKLSHELNETEIDPSIRLRRAIHAGDALLVKRILKSHPGLLHNPDTSPMGLSNSNLHLAAYLGHKEVCQVLLNAGHEDPCPALNENHQTAMMLAAGAGHTEVVHLLCENDSSCILRRDVQGRDAVMEASVGGHDTILQLLLTYVPGGPYEAVQRADAEGNTALHFASGNGNLLGLRTLLAAGADVEKRNIWNWTPAAYSATVQAEVYLKGLVSEVGRLQQHRKEIDTGKVNSTGTVRVVQGDSDLE